MKDISGNAFPVPFHEEERLQALHELALLDTAPDPKFDRITRLASLLLDVPIAIVSLLDRDRQWFKSCFGLELEGTSRDVAFSAHTIMSDEILIVPDALEDPRFRNNPHVTGVPYVRFYAGIPIRSASGFRVGSICVIDTKPRDKVSDEACAALNDLATLASEIIAQQQSVLTGAVSPETGVSVVDTAKQSFLAMLSHELRTPLNAIMGFNTLVREHLVRAGNAEEQVGYSDLIDESSNDLLNRIETMLNWTMIERGDMRVREDRVPVQTVIEKCRHALPEVARAPDRLRVSIDPEIAGAIVLGDQDQLEHALTNIAKNAFQASPEDGVVTIAARHSGGLLLSVDDQGRGMSPDALKRAEAAFEHPESDPFRTRNGLGLGLPLARRIMKMHGGDLFVDTREGEGTTVTLYLPEYRVETP